MLRSDFMKNKIGITSVLIVILEFIGFLIWGFNIQPGDEMGYGLIVIYGIMPLTALILSLILTAKKSVFFQTCFALFGNWCILNTAPCAVSALW